MRRLASTFFVAMFATALLTNAGAVYLSHDVDADRIGKWNLAVEGLFGETTLTRSFLANKSFLGLWP